MLVAGRPSAARFCFPLTRFPDAGTQANPTRTLYARGHSPVRRELDRVRQGARLSGPEHIHGADVARGRAHRTADVSPAIDSGARHSPHLRQWPGGAFAFHPAAYRCLTGDVPGITTTRRTRRDGGDTMRECMERDSHTRTSSVITAPTARGACTTLAGPWSVRGTLSHPTPGALTARTLSGAYGRMPRAAGIRSSTMQHRARQRPATSHGPTRAGTQGHTLPGCGWKSRRPGHHDRVIPVIARQHHHSVTT